MGVADSLANVDECSQQAALVQGLRGSLASPSMGVGYGLVQRLAAHQTHGVKGLIVLWPAGQFINRHNAGMLELSSNLRFLEEAPPSFGMLGLARLDLLGSHL